MQLMSARRRLAEEGGFTIIEASIAMLVVALMFTALSAGLMSGLRATRDARLYQQATSIGEEAVEAARDMPYDDLVMTTSDLVSDPRIQPGPPMTFDPPGDPGPEPVVASTSGGSVDPHITSEIIGNTPFTNSRYVTWVDDNPSDGVPAQSYKRMVVIIEWQIGSKTNRYVTSSFIALARRGLPLPKFELLPEAQTVEVEQGNLVVFPHTIRNLGIIDTYDLEMTTNPRGWVVNFYRDEGQIGVFEPVVDTLLLDSNSTGKPDTGTVGTDETTYFLAVFVLGPTETPGAVDMTLTATSGANDTVTHESKDTIIVGFAGLTLNLHNKPTPPTGDTTPQLHMAMNLSPVSDIPLYRYSFTPPSGPYDYPGRYVDKKNTDGLETSTQFMANWVYQVPGSGNTLFNGTVDLKLWVARRGFDCTGGPAQIRAFLRDKSKEDDSGTEVSLASGNSVMVPTPTEFGVCGFQQVTLNMTLANVNILAGHWVELKVTNRNATGDAILVAYDTATYRSTLKLPQVSSS